MVKKAIKKLKSNYVFQNEIKQIPSNEKSIKKINGYKVVNCGNDNLLPYTLSDVVKGSTTLYNVISSKAEYISGGTLEIEENLNQKLNKNLNKDYGIEELIKRCALDYFTHGFFCIEKIRIGEDIFLYHLPSEKVRLEDDEEDEYKHVLISNDWRKYKYKPLRIPIFPNELKDESQEVPLYRSVLFIKDYDVSNTPYGAPKWISAIYDAQVESLIGQYNANQFENGIHISSILSIDLGEVTDEEELRIKKRLFQKELKGTSNTRSSKSIIHASNSGVSKPEYTQFPMDKEGSYKELQEMTENNIIKACQWFRSLSGLQTAGALGNNQQLKNEWSLAERQVKNFQNKIMNIILIALGKENTTFVFNNTTPLELVGDYNVVLNIVQNIETIGIESSKALLLMLGFENEEVEKIVSNDSI